MAKLVHEETENSNEHYKLKLYSKIKHPLHTPGQAVLKASSSKRSGRSNSLSHVISSKASKMMGDYSTDSPRLALLDSKAG